VSFFAGIIGGGKAKTTMPTAVSGLQLQSSTQGLPIQIVFGATKIAPNLIWYGDFVSIAQRSSAGAGGKGGVGGGGGGKGGGGSSEYVYETAVALGLCEGPITGVGNVYVNKNVVSLASLGLTQFDGSYSQTPWGYLITNHPDEADYYRGLAYVAASSYQLGNSPQLPNHNFEVFGLFYNSTGVSGVPDADPSLVVDFLLSDPKAGAGFPASRVGSLATYQAYCIANGLWVSPAYNQQSPASSILEDLAAATNSVWVWSAGLLTLVPYGDQSVTANGYTYTAPSTPDYDLDDDDFMPAPGQDPVRMTRKRPADAINSVKIECLDRNSQYNPAVVEAKDQALIDVFGLRQQPKKDTHLFADTVAARLSAQLQLQRMAVRNQFAFELDQRYVLLEPMDIVTITESRLGLNRQWVRILEISENDSGGFDILAEEYLNGTGNAPAYSFEENNGYSVNYNSSPGNANPPLIFEPPVQAGQTGGLEVDIACSGGPNWGGCDVWISSDGANYKIAGRVNGPARQGVLSALLPSGADPDTVNTLSVDLSMSSGELLSGTRADADGLHTLCYVDGELISYETADLTSAYRYDLTYLRRGAFGTTIAAHNSGSQFARLDGGIFAYTYDKSKIGQTIYIKLLSFNIYGGGLQSLADVSETVYVLTGPPKPPQVQDFQVTQNANSVIFSWRDVSTDSAIKGYDIAYGDIGSVWSSKAMLTEAHRGTEMTNADVPPGIWEFSIRAKDIADQLGPESLITFKVSNPNSLVVNEAQAPGWPGSLNGFVLHPSGVLVPDSQHTAAYYSDFTPFDTFVPDPVTTASYTSNVIDVGSDSNLRVYDSENSALGPGQTGGAASLAFSIDTWQDGGTDPNTYTPWTSGYVDFRFLKGRITYSGITAGNVSMVTDFTILADVAPSVQESGQLVVAAGGTTLTFPNPYHTAPYVTATPISSSARTASVVSITKDDCVIHVWDSSGADVGGTVNWQATGN
jgi:hypothetical protein